MNWYYESGGQQAGPVSESDLDRLLAEGKITLDTLVWREGLAGWAPLRTARPAMPPPVPGGVPPEGDQGWEVTRPGATAAASAAGSEVPQPGWIRCTLTGRYFPPSEIIYLEGKPYSAAAKPQVVASLQSGAPLPDAGTDRIGPAWEQRATLGAVKAALETVKAVLLTPSLCFATMKREGGLGAPLLFLLTTGGVGIVLSQIYGFFLQGAMFSWMSSMGGQKIPTGAMFGGTLIGMVIGIVAGPILIVVGTFIWAGLVHLSLMMIKGANRPFETTMRVTCYAYGAGLLLNVIPLCGGSIGSLWVLVSMCLGLGKAHDTSTEKGVAATLIPFAVCCLSVIGIYVVIFGAIAAAAASKGGFK
jgi:hypothetical protein